MEPAGLAVGVFGLVGLFSSCLDAAKRIDSWKNFGDDSKILASFFDAKKLLLEKWAEDVGLDQGTIANDDHHEALDDPRIFSEVQKHLLLIKKLYSDADDASPPVAGTDAGRQRLSLRRPVQLQPGTASSESKSQKTKWALKDKEKCMEQVERLGHFVQDLYNLVPPRGANHKG